MFDGVIVTNNRYHEKEDFGEGDLGTSYDAVAFGRAFIANPDLPARCVAVVGGFFFHRSLWRWLRF